MESQILKINRLKDLFNTQKLAALATQEKDHPYLSLMAFACTEDLKSLIVATKRGTRKYSNLVENPGVSFMIDNRLNQEDVFQDTVSVTGVGRAEEVRDAGKNPLTGLFLNRHPGLAPFVQSPDCALIKIAVDFYYIISRFQEVEEIRMMDP
jgi:nitroimidazol reductase NimA-like FMN-containing flavoprotein (pyridoxamine 5'-phosphate oxidase superfamily)